MITRSKAKEMLKSQFPILQGLLVEYGNGRCYGEPLEEFIDQIYDSITNELDCEEIPWKESIHGGGIAQMLIAKKEGYNEAIRANKQLLDKLNS